MLLSSLLFSYHFQKYLFRVTNIPFVLLNLAMRQDFRLPGNYVSVLSKNTTAAFLFIFHYVLLSRNRCLQRKKKYKKLKQSSASFRSLLTACYCCHHFENVQLFFHSTTLLDEKLHVLFCIHLVSFPLLQTADSWLV